MITISVYRCTTYCKFVKARMRTDRDAPNPPTVTCPKCGTKMTLAKTEHVDERSNHEK